MTRLTLAAALMLALACGDDPAPPAPTGGGVPPLGSVGGGSGDGGGPPDGGVGDGGNEVGGDPRLDGGVDAEPRDAGGRDAFGASDIGF